jgi:hypothetical protein
MSLPWNRFSPTFGTSLRLRACCLSPLGEIRRSHRSDPAQFTRPPSEAWGCDAFGNSSNEIAGLFERALRNNFNRAYRRMIFARVDGSEEQHSSGRSNGSFHSGHDEGRFAFAESRNESTWYHDKSVVIVDV